MELILWRHADAEDGADDMARRLTRKGERQADAMAKWLRERLPKEFTVLSSPARRAQQTAAALHAPVTTEKTLAPGASPQEIAQTAQKHKGVVIVVGHQPDLGQAAALLLSGKAAEWRLQKAALWWFEMDGQPLLRAVMSPDLL